MLPRFDCVNFNVHDTSFSLSCILFFWYSELNSDASAAHDMFLGGVAFLLFLLLGGGSSFPRQRDLLLVWLLVVASFGAFLNKKERK